MSKSVRIDDFLHGYRIEVHCLNCNEVYVTNKIGRLKMPRRCKYCGSVKIERLNYYEV